jgi:hypothetical protein
VRWLFSSLAFFGTPDILSYNETPGQPGAFDINEFDDGWYIDDICFTGLLNDQLNLIVDGGDDVLNGTVVECGPNLRPETFAEGDDIQSTPLSATPTCASATQAVVTIVGGNDTVALNTCPTDPTSFCNTATALVNGQPNGATFYDLLTAGQSFRLGAGLSSLDSCVGGSIQYRFERVSPNPVILKGYSSSAAVEVSPNVDSVYDVSVRCSSEPACTDTATVTVLAPPTAACSDIDIFPTATSVDFVYPAVPAVATVDVHEGGFGALGLGTTSLPVLCNDLVEGTDPASCADATNPALGSGDYYLVTCDAPAPRFTGGEQRIGGVPQSRYNNP